MEETTNIITETRQKLILRGYSRSTVRGYSQMLVPFVQHFAGQDLAMLTQEEIQAFLWQHIGERTFSHSYQNQLINARHGMR